MPEEGRLLIVRFSPFTADKCAKNASETFDDDLDDGRTGRYGLSTSGIAVPTAESVDDAIVRLRSIVPLRGKHVAPVWADDLERRGWVVVPDMPPEAHYLIGRGDLSEMPDFTDLALIWADAKRVCPTYVRGGDQR
jgi:hypothetical protein